MGECEVAARCSLPWLAWRRSATFINRRGLSAAGRGLAAIAMSVSLGGCGCLSAERVPVAAARAEGEYVTFVREAMAESAQLALSSGARPRSAARAAQAVGAWRGDDTDSGAGGAASLAVP